MNILLSSFVFLAAGVCSVAGERVYVACRNLGIRVTDLNAETGQLGPMKEALSLEKTGFIALHPNKDVIYATTYTDGPKNANGAIAALEILEEGTLDVMELSATQSNGDCHVSVDATGSVVFTASYSGGSVTTFAVESDGSLSEAVSVVKHKKEVADAEKQPASHAHYFTAGPKNRFAYAPDLGLDQVLIYRFEEESARLAPVGAAELAAGSGPRHMKFSQDGKFAYVLNELNLTVTTFSYNEEDGLLTEVETVSVVPEGSDKMRMSCAQIVVHPNGKFVYSSQRDLRTNKDASSLGRNSLSVYRVTEKGALQRVQTVSAGVRIPRNFNLNPSGKWLLAAGQASEDVQVFAVDDKTGKLAPKGEPVSCPGNPMCIIFARH